MSAVSAILDEDAIRRVIVAHSRGLDRCDEELISAAYFDDAKIHYGPFAGSGGPDAAAALVADLRANTLASTHAVPNTLRTVPVSAKIAPPEPSPPCPLMTSLPPLLQSLARDLSFATREIERLNGCLPR